MNNGILADIVVILHFLFVLFALFGSILAIRWRKTMWLQIPAAIWAMAIEFANLTCPLTPLEKWLIEKEGHAAYSGSFVEHHILSILYPGRLDFIQRAMLGTIVLAINFGIYFTILKQKRKNILK